MKNLSKSQHQAQMLDMIKTCMESGVSNKTFCKNQGITEGVFYYWRKRYQQKSTPQEERFIPVHVKTPQPLNKEIEICYPNGVRVKLPEGMEISLLHSLISLQ